MEILTQFIPALTSFFMKEEHMGLLLVLIIGIIIGAESMYVWLSMKGKFNGSK